MLDFVNTAEDIQKAFEPYYECTVLDEATDPNVLYDLKNTLDTSPDLHRVGNRPVRGGVFLRR